MHYNPCWVYLGWNIVFVMLQLCIQIEETGKRRAKRGMRVLIDVIEPGIFHRTDALSTTRRQRVIQQCCSMQFGERWVRVGYDDHFDMEWH